jgi:DHA2 family metal-tetracycline-proton antiporter-like MFS transporter
MIAEALQQTSYGAAQPLIALRLLQLIPDAAHAQSITGFTFAAAGIVTALAAVIYSRLLRRSSYRVITATAALLTGLTLLGSALATTPALLILTFVAASFLSGALIPAFGTMIGLESPALVQATIFGISSSFVSIGFGFGPLIGGFTASVLSVQAGLAAASVIALLLAALITLAAREPPTAFRRLGS